jgi:dTDP-4-dehydrorhamnose reductase
MKLLISGGSGLLGSKVAEIALARGDAVYCGYAHNEPAIGSPVRLDLADDRGIHDLLDRLRPDAIVHSAALTDVDRCERERELAYRLNVEGTRAIAQACQDVGAFLVYISTDYVFDGVRGMYREDELTNPISYYGTSKLLGEQFCQGCIARTCVIYGSQPASGKINFALWLIDRLRSGKQVSVVTDQFITPTLNTNLAGMVLEAADRRLTGIYHMAGATRISRYDFALQVADIFGLNADLILPSRMADLPWIARRPMDSSLDTSKTSKMLATKPLGLAKSLQILRAEIEKNEVK